MFAKGHGGNIYNNQIDYDFSINTNPMGMPEDVKEKLIENLGEICERYPEETCYKLRKSISIKENISEHHIICGNGAAELIYGLVRAINPKKALMPIPTFSEYARALRAQEAEIVSYPLVPERGFMITEDIMSYLTPDLDMVFLCNPNNPTGRIIDNDLLSDIITYCRVNGIYVVIDECFIEFTEDYKKNTRKGLIPYNPYVVIINALTKLFAFPGIRIGYAMTSDIQLLQAVNMQLPCWNVSAVAQLAGEEVVHHKDYVEESRNLIFKETKYMFDRMKKMGLKVYPPAANFIFFHSDVPLFDELLKRKILIRSCDNFDGIMKGYYRCAVRKHDANVVLLDAIEEILSLK